jgi:FkbM family methyltransferase
MFLVKGASKMSFGTLLIDYIEKRRDKKRKALTGAIGQFWRDGGSQLLYDLPVSTGALIIDAGGYEGEWTAGMIARYGCRSIIYEPVPEFWKRCTLYFKNNSSVKVSKAALGGADREAKFDLSDDGTSECKSMDNALTITADVVDVAKLFDDLGGERVACFKLNIEGGEYEVLERMSETNDLLSCDSLLIQFHRQPQGYEDRYRAIVETLRKSHTQAWCYEMVWEKWVIKPMSA